MGLREVCKRAQRPTVQITDDPRGVTLSEQLANFPAERNVHDGAVPQHGTESHSQQLAAVRMRCRQQRSSQAAVLVRQRCI